MQTTWEIIIAVNANLLLLLKTKQLNSDNLDLIIGKLSTYQQQNQEIGANMREALLQQIARLKYVASNLSEFLADQNYIAYFYQPYSYWFTYEEFKELEQTQNLLQLHAQITDHLNHCWFIRWILEIFTNITQKICWYSYLKLNSLVATAMAITTGGRLESELAPEDKIAEFSAEFTRVTPYLSATQKKYTQKELCQLQFALRQSSTDNNSLQVQLLTPWTFSEAFALTQRHDELQNLVVFNAGLLGLEITGKSYRSLFREILTHAKLLAKQQPTTGEFYCPSHNEDFCIIQTAADWISYIFDCLLRNEAKMQLFLNFADFDFDGENLSQNMVAVTKLNENYIAGTKARCELFASSNQHWQIMQQQYASQPSYQNPLSIGYSADTIVFANRWLRNEFFIYVMDYLAALTNPLQKSDLTSKSIVQLQEFNFASVVADERLEKITNKIEVLTHKNLELAKKLALLDVKISSQTSAFEKQLAKQTQVLLQEVDATRSKSTTIVPQESSATTNIMQHS